MTAMQSFKKEPSPAKCASGAPLPIISLPQHDLLTVNIDQVPMLKDALAPGIDLQPLRLDPEHGEWVILATLKPGCSLPIHYHTGTTEVYTIQGRWLYSEYPDQPQTAGSYLFEPGGSVHTFYVPADNTEDTIALVWLKGAQVCFNEDGTFHSINDATSLQYLANTRAAQSAETGGYIQGGNALVTGS